MITTTSLPTTTASTTALPAPGRRGAFLALLALPLWVVCFVLLSVGNALGPNIVNDLPPAEQAEYYQQFPSGPAAAWAFAVLSLLAIAVMGAAEILLAVAASRLPRLRVAAVVAGVAAVVGTAVQLVNTSAVPGLLAGDPHALPGWVDVLSRSEVNTTLNAVAWTAFGVAVSVLGAVLWLSGVLPRAGLVVAVLGTLVVVVTAAAQLANPMTTAALLCVLGVCLLRRRS